MDAKTLGNLSPSKLEASRLCEARLAGRLNSIEGETEWNEERGEGASVGTLAHEAARIWYRPNEQWLKRVYAGEDPTILAKKAQEIRDREMANVHLVPENSPEAEKQKVAAAAFAARCRADEEINKLGLLKHPWSDRDYVFRKAITDTLHGQFGNELPREADNVSEARILFDTIANHYNRDVLNIAFAERRYKGQIANGVPIHLIIDLGIDRGDGRLEIVDYKTGFITMATEEMYDKDQVLMNLLAVTNYDASLAHYTTKSFTYFWVRSGFETGPVTQTRERLLDYEHYLAVTYQHMLSIEKPKESVNRFCMSCPRRLKCRAFNEMMSEAMTACEVLTPEQIAALSDDEIMARCDRLKMQMKLLEKAVDNIKNVMGDKMAKLNVKSIVGEAFKATQRQNSSDSYNPATVLALCQANKIDPATIMYCTKKRVEETFGNNPQAMQTLGMTMIRGCTSPWVEIRQVSAKKPKKAK